MRASIKNSFAANCHPTPLGVRGTCNGSRHAAIANKLEAATLSRRELPVSVGPSPVPREENRARGEKSAKAKSTRTRFDGFRRGSGTSPKGFSAIFPFDCYLKFIGENPEKWLPSVIQENRHFFPIDCLIPLNCAGGLMASSSDSRRSPPPFRRRRSESAAPTHHPPLPTLGSFSPTE